MSQAEGKQNESWTRDTAQAAQQAGFQSPEAAFKLLFPDIALLSRAERLKLTAERRVRGTLAGKRRSSQLGGSQEFADYRPYVPGDDIRRMDWNVYGRTGRAYIRQYWDEQELQLTLYIDVSRSMQFGDGEQNKAAYSLRLAALAGYAALCGEDRVAVKLYSSDMEQELPMLKGRASSSKLFSFLADALIQLAQPRHTGGASRTDSTTQNGDRPVPAAGVKPNAQSQVSQSNMAQPFLIPGNLPRRSGVTWLITDAMFEEGVEETLLALIAAKQKVVLIHVLSPEELEPDLSGELRLIDSELRTGKEVAVGHRLLADYRDSVRAFRNELEQTCAERGVDYIFLNTEWSMQDSLNRLLAAGVLKN